MVFLAQTHASQNGLKNKIIKHIDKIDPLRSQWVNRPLL